MPAHLQLLSLKRFESESERWIAFVESQLKSCKPHRLANLVTATRVFAERRVYIRYTR